MQEFGLGPNGAMLYCIEYLEANFDWLVEELGRLHPDTWVVFDLPGQVELSTNHESLKHIIVKLGKHDYRLAAVNPCDAHYITDAAKYILVLLLSLRTMLQLELPHVNVLSKIDLLSQFGDLDFNLDCYTEVQDLSYLENLLLQGTKFSALNMRICELVQDFGLVGFETLAVEDRESMLRLMRVVDRATGCVFVPSASEESHVTGQEKVPSTRRVNFDSLFTTAAGPIEAKYGWGAHDVEFFNTPAAAPGDGPGSAALASAANVDKCDVPKVEFGIFDGRTENSFAPSGDGFVHGSALNGNIITHFICNRVKPDSTAKTVPINDCTDAIAATPGKTGQAFADASNIAFAENV
ncbi:hypothetical protein FRC15_011804 [Serendipita sp. 397]|nr:hypothetical protein FRC15_011804 [Serendipita sp. 397]